MRRIVICIGLAFMLFVAVIGCIDMNSSIRPIAFPNTRWVSEEPDMFFEISDGEVYGREPYAQIIIDGEVIEFILEFDISGVGITFTELSALDPYTGTIRVTPHTRRTRGMCRFSPDRLVVYDLGVRTGGAGFLDESITEIVFIREDMKPLD